MSDVDYTALPATDGLTAALIDDAVATLTICRGGCLDDPAARISALVSLAGQADDLLHDAVAGARDAGCSWDVIADRLATTAATARRRYGLRPMEEEALATTDHAARSLRLGRAARLDHRHIPQLLDDHDHRPRRRHHHRRPGPHLPPRLPRLLHPAAAPRPRLRRSQPGALSRGQAQLPRRRHRPPRPSTPTATAWAASRASDEAAGPPARSWNTSGTRAPTPSSTSRTPPLASAGGQEWRRRLPSGPG